MNFHCTDYRMEVLDQLASGRRSLAWAKWRLKHGSLGRWIVQHLPALFFVVHVRAHKGPNILIPLMILPIWILAAIGLPIAQLVLVFQGKKPIPGVGAGLLLLFKLQFAGRGPIVHVQEKKGDMVDIRLW